MLSCRQPAHYCLNTLLSIYTQSQTHTLPWTSHTMVHTHHCINTTLPIYTHSATIHTQHCPHTCCPCLVCPHTRHHWLHAHTPPIYHSPHTPFTPIHAVHLHRPPSIYTHSTCKSFTHTPLFTSQSHWPHRVHTMLTPHSTRTHLSTPRLPFPHLSPIIHTPLSTHRDHSIHMHTAWSIPTTTHTACSLDRWLQWSPWHRAAAQTDGCRCAAVP